MNDPIDDSDPLPRLPPRAPDSHKGDFGRALLIGGSRGMTGAISLAGMAALRSGAGLVTLAVADPCLETVAGQEPCYMTVPLQSDPQGRIAQAARQHIIEAAASATVLACGPGLGRSEQLSMLVQWLYQNIEQPMVFDADALNALAQQPAVLSRGAGPRILTPHPGEFARLMGRDKFPANQREPLARELAKSTGAIVVLKGHRTVVTDGRRSSLNTTGNPGMASGGTGDVLTGVITALLCQGLAAYEAARLGVYVHGLAGDLAATQLGHVGLIARDLIAHLPHAFRSLQEQERPAAKTARRGTKPKS